VQPRMNHERRPPSPRREVPEAQRSKARLEARMQDDRISTVAGHARGSAHGKVEEGRGQARIKLR
jgi:hypothetical protein